MARFQDIVTDQNDAPIAGAFVTVRNYPAGTLAAITDDNGLALPNPLTADSGGSYYFNAPSALYTLEFRLLLNEVVRKVREVDLSDTLRTDLANSANGALGAALAAFNSALTYTAGSVGAFLNSLVASTGSALVGFLQSGTGAVARTVQDKLRDLPGAKDFGAKVDGVTDDATAIAAAAATGKTFIVSNGTIITSAVPSAFSLVGLGATFGGSVSLDSPYPTFDPGAIQVIQKGNGLNCFIGIAHNSLAANSVAEPVGVTGYGRVDNAGNSVFGVFGRADLYASTGCAGNELDSFNYGASNPSTAFPVDRSLGTSQTVPTALITAAGGTKNSHTAHFIGKEGSAPQSFLNGIHCDATAVVNYFTVLSNGASLLHWIKPDGTMLHQGATSASGGIGYSTGAGGAVTQATSKSTGVTLNKACGQITMNGAALAANTIVSFILTNSLIGADDDVRVWVKSGNASVGSYRVAAEGNASASRSIVVENKTAGSLSEAIVLGFNVLKAVVA